MTAFPQPLPAAHWPLRRRRWALALPVLHTVASMALVLPLVAPEHRLQVGSFLLAVGVLGTLGAWQLVHRLDRAWKSASTARLRLQEYFDALPLGISVYDAQDRLALFNRSFAELYPTLVDKLMPGTPFEDLLRASVARGLVPEAKGREEAWIQERLWSHRESSYGAMREMADGRWRRITEHRLSDGARIGYSVDVDDLVRREQSIEALRREAEVARTRLREAIEALPAGFELYDAQDRLILTNGRMREYYPRVAHLLETRPTFEELVRANFAAGGLPARAHDFEPWLANRLLERRKPGEARVHALADGRWVRVHERRTSEGGLVGVRIDVTDSVLGGAPDGARAPRGLHLTADLSDVDVNVPLMTDAPALAARMVQAVHAAGLSPVAECFHAFGGEGGNGGGVTGVVLLAESHVAIHTWPEDGRVTVDVFVCNRSVDNRQRARSLMDALVPAFNPGSTERHRIARGTN